MTPEEHQEKAEAFLRLAEKAHGTCPTYMEVHYAQIAMVHAILSNNERRDS